MEKNSEKRAIILCGGEMTRWKNPDGTLYRNTPKHLIEIEGEVLLERTVRLLRENGIEEIHIVIKKDVQENGYYIDGAETHEIVPNYEENADADKFLSSKFLWSNHGRTIVIYGDCFFTEEAMTAIVGYDGLDWMLFCRPDASHITGGKWGECFAQSFLPRHLEEHEKQLHRIASLWKTKKITRCGGWEHYRAMVGRPDDKIRHPHKMSTNWTKIDDWTEDFDFPEDFIAWQAKRNIWTSLGEHKTKK